MYLVIPVDAPVYWSSAKEKDLQSLQILVGGYIERCMLPDPDLCLIVDEEGLIKPYPQVNERVRKALDTPLVGTVILAAANLGYPDKAKADDLRVTIMKQDFLRREI